MGNKNPKEKASTSKKPRANKTPVSEDKAKLTQAEETLNQLIEAAGPEAVKARLRAAGRSTRNAMDALFDDASVRHPVSGMALVGMDGSTGVAEHDTAADVQDGQAPRLAGAEDADSTAPQPEAEIRQLDDGVDFWDDLDRTGKLPDDSEEDD